MISFNIVEHGHRIAKEAGTHFNPAVDIVIARVSNSGELLGGVVYTNYTGASIGIHVAGFRPDWLNRDMLWVTFHYAFVQLGVKKVFAQMREANTKALEFNRKLGFKIVAKVADVFPDGACILSSLAREDCRWLDLKPRELRSR